MGIILYAGYGFRNTTWDVTEAVKAAYDHGTRDFLANNNQWGGDPAPGQKKSLFIVWKDNGDHLNLGVVPEGDPKGILLPSDLGPR